MSRADNIDSEEAFLTALADRRRTTQRTEPVVAQRYQSEIRVFAEDLQTGKITVGGAERAVGTWARRAYGTRVEVFILDCAAGRTMQLPDRLIEMPVVVMAYAAAHFRPRSLANAQCAILTAVVVGSATVEQARP